MVFFIAGTIIVGIIVLFNFANDRARARSQSSDSTGDNSRAAHNGNNASGHGDSGDSGGDGGGD